jgi:hypothetical protein
LARSFDASKHRRATTIAYFSEVLIEVNLVLSLVPSPFTIAMIVGEMPAAISLYSMAVAPDPSARNLRFFTGRSRPP